MSEVMYTPSLPIEWLYCKTLSIQILAPALISAGASHMCVSALHHRVRSGSAAAKAANSSKLPCR